MQILDQGRFCEWCQTIVDTTFIWMFCMYWSAVWSFSVNLLGRLRSVMVKKLDCGMVVSRYYVHFQTDTPRNGMNPLILQANTTVLL